MTTAREKIEILIKDSISPYRNDKEKIKKKASKKLTPLIKSLSKNKRFDSKLIVLLIFGYIILLFLATFNI